MTVATMTLMNGLVLNLGSKCEYSIASLLIKRFCLMVVVADEGHLPMMSWCLKSYPTVLVVITDFTAKLGLTLFRIGIDPCLRCRYLSEAN